MTSLRLSRHLSSQEIVLCVHWVTTADGCVHTADATQLDSSLSRVGVGGVYWTLVASVRSVPLTTRWSLRSLKACAAAV